MKKIFYFFAATVVLAAVGCSKDDAASNDAKYVSEIKIGFEGDTRVSASHSAAGLKFAWEDGDVIYVSRTASAVMANEEFKYDASSGTFKPGNNSVSLKAGEKYIAVYKASLTKYNDGIKVNVQQTREISDMSDNMPMVSTEFTADANGTIATMTHIVGMVEIPVKSQVAGKKLKEIMITATDYTNLGGTFNMPVSDYSISLPSGGFNYVRLKSATGIDLNQSTATSVFIPVLPCTNAVIDLDYKLDDDTEWQYISNSDLGGKTLTVERGKITKISELVLGDNAE